MVRDAARLPPLILLIGGTSETAPLANALADAGARVLVSTATEIVLDCGARAAIRRRSGRLDQDGMRDLLAREGVACIVDAAHPFAIELHQTARAVARAAGLPFVRYERAETAADISHARILTAGSHAEAARLACGAGKRVLLTTGSRCLKPYVEAARASGAELFARVLPEVESLEACRVAGLGAANIIAARGPFSLEANRALIARLCIDVLVTKDSGAAGGVPEKLAAAEAENCAVVLVRRPNAEHGSACRDATALLAELAQLRVLSPPGAGRVPVP